MNFRRLWSASVEPMALGLDLQSGRMRAVLLQEGHAGGCQWLASHCFDGAEAGMDAMPSPQALRSAAALAQWLAGLGVAAPTVVSALPSDAFAMQRLPVPVGLHADDYELLVQAEAAQRWGFSADAYQLDFAGPDASGAMLVVAAQRERVAWMQAFVQAAGLELAVLEVAQHALQRAAWQAWQRSAPDAGRPQAVLVMGDGVARLGGRTSQGQWQEQDMPTWPHGQWLPALQQALLPFEPHPDGAAALWLACTAVPDAGLLQQWEQATGWRCRLLSPFAGMAGAPDTGADCDWSVATGLALRGLQP